jgi:7,8-dihydropterin-6-yl-methyl-4-(beta-D-ribofuranosyl)aminobenzene 5'-phosphate synthase
MRAVDRTHVEAIALEPVDALTVTTLVDNVTDSLLPDHGPARRPSMAASPRMPAPLLAGGNTDDALRAEHGFSVLVTITKEGRETRVLFDAGRTPDGLVENMRRLDLPPADIDIIVLSHGHWDHVTGMDGLVGRLGRASMPTLIHPEFWTRRRLAFPGRDPFELPSTSKSALQGAGFEIVEQRQPSFLLDGSLLVTGEVDRTAEFERGFPGHEAHRHSGWEPDPLILDDQALVATIRGRGLVVLTGCGHSGIVNILRYVRTLTGENRTHAVLGVSTSAGRRSSRSSGRPATRSKSSRRTTLCPRTAPAGAPLTRSPLAFRERSSRTASALVSSSSRPTPTPSLRSEG